MVNPVIREQSIAEIEAETVINDYQSIDLDINSLVDKFIKPIDRYRSRNAPNITSNQLNQPGLVSSDSLEESRCHAFYRMLGLPVIAPDGKFFNPGYNPRIDAKEIARQQSIVNSIPEPVRKHSQKRESESRMRYNVFRVGSETGTVFAITMGLRGAQRSFAVADLDSIKSLEKPPSQIQTLSEREIYIKKLYKKRSGGELTYTNKTVEHKIAPFMTDPIISANLDPNSGNQSVVVGAPFLEKEDLEHEYNKYLKRPGLEFILRLRLRQQKIAEQSGVAIDNIDLSMFEDEISSGQQKEIAATLIDKDGLSAEDVKQVLEGSGRVELYTVNNLVRMYKGLIHLYNENLEVIENVSKQIIWIPVSNDGGPEKGTEVSTAFVVPSQFPDSWVIERSISGLQVKAALANLQVEIGETADETPLSFGDFTISEFQNIANDFENQKQEEINKRNSLEAQASNALRVIELIGGEVSGFGLIDIIAIWMALWSVDVNVLLDLIDDPGAFRLNQIKELKTQATEDRAQREGFAKEAYEKLAERIQTILSYGDRLFKREQNTLREDSGDIPRDENGVF